MNTKIEALLEKFQLPEAICEARDKWDRTIVGFLTGDKDITTTEARQFDKRVASVTGIVGIGATALNISAYAGLKGLAAIDHEVIDAGSIRIAERVVETLVIAPVAMSGFFGGLRLAIDRHAAKKSAAGLSY